MKTTVFLIALLLPFLSFAQSVSCKPQGDAHYVRLEITKEDGPMEYPWYVARLDNQYHQRQVFIVNSRSQGEKLLFISKDGKSDFTLDFGKYRGPGTYHSVKLMLKTGTAKEEKASLTCDQAGDLGFVDSCKIDKPEAAFFDAIRTRNLEGIEDRLECGLNVNLKDEKGCSALLVLGDSNCGSKTGSNFNYRPMVQALTIAQLLKKKGAAMESKDPANAERALHKFVKFRDWDVVDFLLEKGADVDAQDVSGITPLMRAVETNDKFLVQRLVEANPDLSLKNSEGKTALRIAEELGYKKLIPLLQEPQQIILVEAQTDGTCSPLKIRINANEATKFTLKATEEDMFLMEAPALGLSLMADAESEASQTLLPNKEGIFEFTCGVHHGSLQSTGQIMID